MDSVKLEYESKKDEKQIYLDDIENIITEINDPLEGNCFYSHCTSNSHCTSILQPQLYSKQVNLFWCGKQAVENICEIGFNAGHSTMLMLLGREKTPLNYTIFDKSHYYGISCFEYIKSKFPHINFEHVEGDSTVTMPEWINNHTELMYKYDVVHVDGGHTEHCISNDMKNADLLVKNGGIIIVDDVDGPHINKYVDLYISNGNYIELNLLSTQEYMYPHRIIKKI